MAGAQTSRRAAACPSDSRRIGPPHRWRSLSLKSVPEHCGGCKTVNRMPRLASAGPPATDLLADKLPPFIVHLHSWSAPHIGLGTQQQRDRLAALPVGSGAVPLSKPEEALNGLASRPVSFLLNQE